MASGSVPALPTQQMLIQIRIKIIILIIIKKTTRQQQQQHTKQNALYRRQSEERGERKKRGGERETTVSFTTFVCSGVKRGERKNYSKEDSATFNPKPEKQKLAVKSSTAWEATRSEGEDGAPARIVSPEDAAM